ncbi:dynein light chain Tctex-type 5-B-like [Polyodon spathula]|uniref:dynein light chain Tctex-type 5-B-like n=1 Tax=Polyodon spathula TaxID=7913 RepID=UPI001B7E546A|nr:dynein light chain Tctex-type 5-B-like [Polyodon spathula]
MEMEKQRKAGSCDAVTSMCSPAGTGAKPRDPQKLYTATLAKRESHRKRDKDTRTVKSRELSGQSIFAFNPKSIAANKSLYKNPVDNCCQPQPEKTFSAEEARQVMKAVAEERLRNAEYDGNACSALARELADCVKHTVKELLFFERYKIICFVVLGPVKQSDLCCCSRSVWCPSVDTYAEYCFKNHSLFALCVLYAVYSE